MTRFIKPALLGTTAMLFTASLAFAAPKADTNNDGQITKAEFIAEANLKFINTDTNADGLLSEDERKAAKEAYRDKRAAKRFAKVDLNGDGVITEAEYNAKRQERTEKRANNRERRMERLTNSGSVTAERMRSNSDEFRRGRDHRASRIKRDTNDDGFITRAEFDAATEAMFERMDVNNDGVLTKGEGRKRKRKKRGFWTR